MKVFLKYVFNKLANKINGLSAAYSVHCHLHCLTRRVLRLIPNTHITHISLTVTEEIGSFLQFYPYYGLLRSEMFRVLVNIFELLSQMYRRVFKNITTMVRMMYEVLDLS